MFINNKAQSSKTCYAFYVLKRKKLRLDVKSSFLLYKNDFKFQLGFKVVVKKGTNKIKSSLQTIDFEYDTIKFKIKK